MALDDKISGFFQALCGQGQGILPVKPVDATAADSFL